MKSLLVVIVALSAPALALAQTTDCLTDATGKMTCTTRPKVDRDKTCLRGGIAAVAAGCSAASIAQAKARDKERKTLGALIADGQCDQARNQALRSGDLELAERVTRLCAAN